MGKHKQYTEEVQEGCSSADAGTRHRTVAEVAKGLGLSQSMLYRWHERYGIEVSGRPAASQT